MTAFIYVRINPTGPIDAVNLVPANRMLLTIRMIFTILLQQKFSYKINQFFSKILSEKEKNATGFVLAAGFCLFCLLCIVARWSNMHAPASGSCAQNGWAAPAWTGLFSD
jgi:dolichol kinase